MALNIAGLTGPVLAFANSVSRDMDALKALVSPSPKLVVFADPSALPDATAWDRRAVILDDNGSAQTVVAVARYGSWHY